MQNFRCSKYQREAATAPTEAWKVGKLFLLKKYMIWHSKISTNLNFFISILSPLADALFLAHAAVSEVERVLAAYLADILSYILGLCILSLKNQAIKSTLTHFLSTQILLHSCWWHKTINMVYSFHSDKFCILARFMQVNLYVRLKP